MLEGGSRIVIESLKSWLVWVGRLLKDCSNAPANLPLDWVYQIVALNTSRDGEGNHTHSHKAAVTFPEPCRRVSALPWYRWSPDSAWSCYDPMILKIADKNPQGCSGTPQPAAGWLSSHSQRGQDLGSPGAINPQEPDSRLWWEQKLNFHFISNLNLHMINFSLGSERFLPRRFLMWSFHFAVEFLCAAPLSHLNQQQKSGTAEVGGESEWEGRHFRADMSGTERTERAAEAYGDLLWLVSGIWTRSCPAYPRKTETSAVVEVTVACLEGLCTCWGLNLPRFSPPTLTVTLAIYVLIYNRGEIVKNVHPPASVCSSPVPPPPHAEGGRTTTDIKTIKTLFK